MKIAFLTLEMLIPELSEPHRGANFRGGLGILAGDIMSGIQFFRDIEAVGFTPLYYRPWFAKESKLSYEKYEILKKFIINVDKQDFIVAVKKIERAGKSIVYGIEQPEILDVLYVENRQRRLLQEILFSKAVIEVLKITNFQPDIVWLNESHTALTLALLRGDLRFEQTRTLFTIHTPEQAGIERFYEYRFDTLGIDFERYGSIFVHHGVLDFVWAAMLLSDVVNAVSKEHAETTKVMFPQVPRSKIIGIRNGTDIRSWSYPELLPFIVKEKLSENILLEIHNRARKQMLEIVEKKSGVKLDFNKPTVGFVRRIAGYKNLHPILKDILPAICAERGAKIETPLGQLLGLGMQVVGAGMASETDNVCLWWMSDFSRMAQEEFFGKFIFIPEYSFELLQMAAWGFDILLVTPQPKREACSTSDQRAAINGIPTITSKTGGMKEYIQEFDLINGTGNGFFIDPYCSQVLYQKLSIFSNLWYEWFESGKGFYPKLKFNVFQSAKKLDIQETLEKYRKLFLKILD